MFHIHRKHWGNLFVITQSKVNPFLKFFHWQISNELLCVYVIKIPTSARVHYYTTLQNLNGHCCHQTMQQTMSSASTDYTVISTVTRNYCSPSCLAFCCSETKQFKSTCSVNQWLIYEWKFGGNFNHSYYAWYYSNAPKMRWKFLWWLIPYFLSNLLAKEFRELLVLILDNKNTAWVYL